MADDFADLDPSTTSVLTPDALREWGEKNLDFRTNRLLGQDPSAAIDSMVKRGIPPPDFHVSGALPYTNSDAWANSPIEPPLGTITEDNKNVDLNPIVRTTPQGKIAGNLTSPANPDAPPVAAKVEPVKPAVPLSVPPSKTPVKAEDEETAPVLTPEQKRQNAIDDAEADAEDEKKAKASKAGDALSEFSKSLSGVKAPNAPPLNPVGTPGVRGTSGITPPNLSNLMSLLSSGAVPASVAPSLGKLLVQGKA